MMAEVRHVQIYRSLRVHTQDVATRSAAADVAGQSRCCTSSPTQLLLIVVDEVGVLQIDDATMLARGYLNFLPSLVVVVDAWLPLMRRPRVGGALVPPTGGIRAV